MRTTTALPTERAVVTIDGRLRTATVLGARHAVGPRPLVLVFHGSRQTAAAHRRVTGDPFADMVRGGGAVVAYLDGHRGHWNDARRQNVTAARREDIDDIAFARAIAERVADTHGTDVGRIAAFGYSNGGQLVFRLLHEAPDLLAAAVIVSAAMPAPEDFLSPADGSRMPPAHPTPIVLVHGTRDRIAPFDGGTMSRSSRVLFGVGGRTLSAHDTAAHFARSNGITTTPSIHPVPPRPASRARTTAVRIEHRQDATPPVVLYEIRGGGHTVPGMRPAPRLLGRTSADVTPAELITEALRGIRPES